MSKKGEKTRKMWHWKRYTSMLQAQACHSCGQSLQDLRRSRYILQMTSPPMSWNHVRREKQSSHLRFFLFFPPTCRIYYSWVVLFFLKNVHFYWKSVNFSFFIFLSSDISWPRNFIYIFFPPTCRENPCRDPSSVENNASCLSQALPARVACMRLQHTSISFPV